MFGAWNLVVDPMGTKGRVEKVEDDEDDKMFGAHHANVVDSNQSMMTKKKAEDDDIETFNTSWELLVRVIDNDV